MDFGVAEQKSFWLPLVCLLAFFRSLRGPRRWPYPCGVFWVLLGGCPSGVRCHLGTGVAVQMRPNITKDNKCNNQEL